MTRDTRLRMALELTRMVWELKEEKRARGSKPSEQMLDVFMACFRRIEELAKEGEAPIVPAD